MGHAIWIALAVLNGLACAQEIRWAPNIVAARRAAMEYKVPLLVHFYGDNCLPCKLLEQNVLARSEVVETLNKYFICVRINGSQERQLAAEYGVHSWPTDVFLSPDGKPLDQGVCKQSPGEYLSVLRNMAVQNRDRNVLLASQQTQQAQQVTSQVANHPSNVNPMHAMVAGAASVPAPAQPASVVANAWTGKPRDNSGHSQTLDNPHFANAPAMPEAPTAAEMPSGILPAAPPTDALPPLPSMQMVQMPSMTSASPNPPISGSNPSTPKLPVSSSKTFASTVSFQTRAASSVPANQSTAAAHGPNLPATTEQLAPALDGYCPVALKSQGAWLKGQPQFAVKHRGRIYYLGSQSAMQEFLQNPDSCSPMLSGYDAMVFLNEGKLVDGDTHYGLHEQDSGSILLFSSAESKQAYEQDYERNTQALKVVLRKAGVEQ